MWLRARRTHPPHDGDGLGGEEARVAHLVVDDAVEHLLLIVTGERGLGGRDTRIQNTTPHRAAERGLPGWSANV